MPGLRGKERAGRRRVHREEESLGGAEFLEWEGREGPLVERTRKWSGQDLVLSYPYLGRKLPPTGDVLLLPGLYCTLEQKVRNLVIFCVVRATEGNVIPPDQDGTKEHQIRLS